MNPWLAIYLLGFVGLAAVITGYYIGDDDVEQLRRGSYWFGLLICSACWPVFILWTIIQNVGRKGTP